jgi:Ca-activated chloride channel family protein
MLAQDVLPNRAEKAKQALLELSDSLQQRGGHRVALVAFAGRARIVCPLTHDYDHFRTALVDLDANTLPADLRASGEAPTSGTRIGAALHAAILAHDPGMDGHQDILLLSDGDDPAQDGEWQQGALEARSRRIPVHTVGIGDPKLGSPIPNKDGKPLKYQNEMVMTRLEEQPLAEIARLTNGTFTPARTDSLPLAELFHQRMEPRGVKNQSEDAMPLYRQQYGWFFAPALFLLGAEMLIGRGVQRQRRRSEEHL